MKLSAGVAVLALVLMVGACSADDPKRDEAADPESPTASSTPSGSPSSTPTEDAYPEFTAQDYRYVLVQSCYCPFTMPVEVTVEGGKVTSAVAKQASRTVAKGDPAPESLRLTINDIIAQANDPEGTAKVTWPQGQEWPNRVRLDRIEGAVDDEITYVLRNVRVK